MSARDSWLGSLGLDSGRVEFPSSAALVELALAAGEGQLTDTGSLSVQTGRFTGRCPERRFIVSGGTAHNDVDWGKVNKPISREEFDSWWQRALAYLGAKARLYGRSEEHTSELQSH